jgi:hypothetical protein
MHTSAQQVDLSLALSGMLTADAEVRTGYDKDGHAIPVIFMQLDHQHNSLVKHIVLQRPYPSQAHQQAEQDAKQLKRGRCITFESTTDDMRIVFPRVTAINIL